MKQIFINIIILATAIALAGIIYSIVILAWLKNFD